MVDYDDWRFSLQTKTFRFSFFTHAHIVARQQLFSNVQVSRCSIFISTFLLERSAGKLNSYVVYFSHSTIIPEVIR